MSLPFQRFNLPLFIWPTEHASSGSGTKANSVIDFLEICASTAPSIAVWSRRDAVAHAFLNSFNYVICEDSNDISLFKAQTVAYPASRNAKRKRPHLDLAKALLRSADVATYFSAEGHSRSGQAFAIGNLRMRTKYEGRVLREWLVRFSKDPAKVKSCLCDPNAYSPRTYCRGGARVSDKTAISQLKRYLPREWNTLSRLRLNPTKILGEDPPWKDAELTYAQTRPSM